MTRCDEQQGDIKSKSKPWGSRQLKSESSKPESSIWSRDSVQRTPNFDSCQLKIASNMYALNEVELLTGVWRRRNIWQRRRSSTQAPTIHAANHVDHARNM